MRKRILFLYFWLSLPSQSHANSAVTNMQAVEIIYGKETNLCKEVFDILNSPINAPYLKGPRSDGMTLWSIPPGNKKIEAIFWEKTTTEDFKRYLPEEYLRIEVASKRLDPKIKLGEVYKTEVDIYNRGQNDLIFNIDLSYGHRNYLYDTDPIRLGFVQYFNDNASIDVPFIFLDRVYLSRLDGNRTVTITELGKRDRGEYPQRKLCKYKIND